MRGMSRARGLSGQWCWVRCVPWRRLRRRLGLCAAHGQSERAGRLTAWRVMNEGEVRSGVGRRVIRVRLADCRAATYPVSTTWRGASTTLPGLVFCFTPLLSLVLLGWSEGRRAHSWCVCSQDVYHDAFRRTVACWCAREDSSGGSLLCATRRAVGAAAAWSVRGASQGAKRRRK